MDTAIKHHFGKDIKEQIQLTGGWTYQTWLLTLSDNKKVVFRTQRDFETAGGRKIIIADILQREKFFYDTVNKRIGHICPEVYAIDGTREYHENSYCIMEYIDGIPLNSCFPNFDKKKQNDILFKIGETAAKINEIEIDKTHPYVKSRNSWEDYIANRIYERISPLVKYEIITLDEANRITENMRHKKAKNTLSFLHLDMRHCNMIYNNGEIFVLDAENCEFGDPLHELAVIDVGMRGLDAELLEGYKSICSDIDITDEIYFYYKLERLGLVVDVYINEIPDDSEGRQYYLKEFNETKNVLLS